MIPNDSTFSRFYAKLPNDIRPDTCWPWQGYLNCKGYGLFYMEKDDMGAHRAAYKLLVGRIPNGLTIHHKCLNTCCVNPMHLEIVTNRTNWERGTGRNPTLANALKTHCLKGHPFSGENLRLGPRGYRNCRTCERAKVRRQEAEKRLGALIATQRGK